MQKAAAGGTIIGSIGVLSQKNMRIMIILTVMNLGILISKFNDMYWLDWLAGAAAGVIVTYWVVVGWWKIWMRKNGDQADRRQRIREE